MILLTSHNVIILINSVLDKDQNYYYFNIFLEKCTYQLKNIHKNVFDSIIMLRFGETKILKAKFYAAKKPLNIWNVNIDDIVTSNLI